MEQKSLATYPKLKGDAAVRLPNQSYRCINTEENDCGKYISEVVKQS